MSNPSKITEVTSTAVANENNYKTLNQHEKWQPGFFGQMPWLGSAALILAIMDLTAAVAVLAVSDGKEVNSWKYHPTVYLSISYTLTNVAIQYALAHGVTMTWWTQALREGTKLKDLHNTYAFGTSLWSALTAGRSLDIIAIASILATLAPINGPLFQKASQIGSVEKSDSPQLTVGIQNLLTRGWTGIVTSRANFGDKPQSLHCHECYRETVYQSFDCQNCQNLAIRSFSVRHGFRDLNVSDLRKIQKGLHIFILETRGDSTEDQERGRTEATIIQLRRERALEGYIEYGRHRVNRHLQQHGHAEIHTNLHGIEWKFGDTKLTMDDEHVKRERAPIRSRTAVKTPREAKSAIDVQVRRIKPLKILPSTFLQCAVSLATRMTSPRKILWHSPLRDRTR